MSQQPEGGRPQPGGPEVDIDALLAGGRPPGLPPRTDAEADALLEPERMRLDRPMTARLRAVTALRGLRAERDLLMDALGEADEDTTPSEDDRAAAEVYESAVYDALEEAQQAYLDALPRVPIARCPFNDEEVRVAIDVEGIDGPWWNYQGALRPVEDRPGTLIAFTGALRLAAGPEWTAHLVKPGPAVPYVLPRLLEVDGVQAVIRSLMVGRHVAWVISYYAQSFPAGLQRANDWAADFYPVRDEAGEWGWGTVDEDTDPRDVDLAKWIERGRLAWIAPGDASLELRHALEGCPFLGVEGEQNVQRIHEGEVWAPPVAPLPVDA